MELKNNLTLNDLNALCRSRIENVFATHIEKVPALLLKTAMHYSLSNNGKLLRPLLVYASGMAFNAPLANLDIPAAAIEAMHTYSLIHDDLPCMDNADLRRGKATCHKIYGDGMAVLTGDALQTLAIQIITNHPVSSLNTDKRLRMIAVLSNASGAYGMAAGQALDITVMHDQSSISPDLLLDIYRLKTGALFTASLELGRLAAKEDDDNDQKALKEFGDNVGLAFQIQDDILDVEVETATLGKPQGIDLHNNKITYVNLFGLDQAKLKVEALYKEALEAIDYIGNRAQLLRELTRLMLERRK